MISIAKVGSTFGFSGELKLYILSESVENALSYKLWHIRKKNARQWSILSNQSIKQLGNKFLIKFDRVNTKEQASSFTNAIIAVPRSELKASKEGEYYWVDLIGLKVINQSGDNFGYVGHVFETGANEVLCCKENKREFLIPFTSKYIVFVDKMQKKIIVDWQYDY